jgi:hypothetical protein
LLSELAAERESLLVSEQVTVSELAELMEEVLDTTSSGDDDIMTYSQFKRMMEFSGV